MSSINNHSDIYIAQKVLTDPANSSTTNLTAGNSYTFDGTATSTLGVAGIQVSLFTDQQAIVKISQSSNGTNWDLIDTYFYAPSSNFGLTVQAISSYFKVTVTTNAQATSVFRLQSILCPIVDAVPRSLDGYGNFKITTGRDAYGFQSENTPMGEIRVIEPVKLAGTGFEGFQIDTSFWNTSATGTGASIVQSGCQLALTSGTGASNVVYAYSVRRTRYVGGSSMRYRGIIQNAAGTANNVRRWGIGFPSNFNFTISVGTPALGNTYTVNNQQFTVMQISGATIHCYGTGAPTASGTLTFVSGDGTQTGNLTYTAFAAEYLITDGAYFKLNNTTLSVNTMKAGSETSVTSFNGQLGYSYTLDTNARTFEIYWTNTRIFFVVSDVLLHTVSAITAPWSNSMGFYVFMDNINTAAATSVAMNCRVATIYRLGKIQTAPIYKNITGNAATWILKTTPGRLQKLIFNNTSGTSVQIFDSKSAAGPLIGTITTASSVIGPWSFDIDFYNGLTIVTAGNGLDATVVYE